MESNFSVPYVNLKINKSESENNYINFKSTITPIYLCINDKKIKTYKSKCMAMILDFSDIPQDVGAIFFKNYYTYSISILVMKISYTDSDRLKKWYIAIEPKVQKILN